MTESCTATSSQARGTEPLHVSELRWALMAEAMREMGVALAARVVPGTITRSSPPPAKQSCEAGQGASTEHGAGNCQRRRSASEHTKALTLDLEASRDSPRAQSFRCNRLPSSSPPTLASSPVKRIPMNANRCQSFTALTPYCQRNPAIPSPHGGQASREGTL